MEQALTQNISRENLGMKTGLFSTLGNVLLFICKYLTGTLCGNVAVLAESFDNLMDSAWPEEKRTVSIRTDTAGQSMCLDSS